MSAFGPISGHTTTGLVDRSVFVAWIRPVYDENGTDVDPRVQPNSRTMWVYRSRVRLSHFCPGDQTGLIHLRQCLSVAAKQKSKHSVHWEHSWRNICGSENQQPSAGQGDKWCPTTSHRKTVQKPPCSVTCDKISDGQTLMAPGTLSHAFTESLEHFTVPAELVKG